MVGRTKWWLPCLAALLTGGAVAVVFLQPFSFEIGSRSSGAESFFLSYHTHPKAVILKKELPEPCVIAQLHRAMEFYATHACGNCHRLKGFDGNVTFKSDDPDASLWFQKLFPSQLTGEMCLDALDNHLFDLEQRLVVTDRQDTILQILEKNPDVSLVSYFPAFDFAYKKKIKEFTDKKTPIPLQTRWKSVFRNTLFFYIETYGLGRLIAPPLHWCGVYREESWLMGHFKDPAAYTPGTYMPAFPFSEQEFYDLTKMLVILGQKNRDELYQEWQKSGYNPEKAYQLCCADCHGANLEGNGPVAARLYPVVKNLKNTAFMLGLTKTRTSSAIENGIVGTSMPPWDKSYLPDHKPVLTSAQITQMVSWIYSMLPDDGSSYQVPHYTIENVVQELKNEKSPLQGIDIFTQKETSGEVEYRIQRDLFTPANLEAGEKLFEASCASCHGEEGHGNGKRKLPMKDAKPQNLRNVTWLNACDDLFLLKAIKYGVPGTAMTPFGDNTSALQRLQLVMYIRSLSEGKEFPFEADQQLYTSFIASQEALERLKCYASQQDALKEKVSALIASVQKENDLYEKLAETVAASGQRTCAEKFLHMLEVHGSLFSWNPQAGLICNMRQEEIAEKARECQESTKDPSLSGMIKECQDQTAALREEQIRLYKEVVASVSGIPPVTFNDQGGSPVLKQPVKKKTS